MVIHDISKQIEQRARIGKNLFSFRFILLYEYNSIKRQSTIASKDKVLSI